MALDCAACGKTNIAVSYPVLKASPAGDYQELGVCEDCKPRYMPVETLFVRSDGQTYTQEQRPPFWSNGLSVRWQEGQVFNPSPVSLTNYPLIEDFEVLIEGVISKHKLGKEAPFYFVWLFSPSRGYLTHILGADELRDLCRRHFALPRGDFTRPYHDLDQGWRIVLAEDDAFVYVLSGGRDESASFDVYETWFKVEKNLYHQQWKQAQKVARSLRRKKIAL